MDLFHEEREAEAISRIKKFAKIADKMNFKVAVGFSGGKDSQVVYDLCKRAGIKFVAYFNHCFESSTTLRFIKEYYPEVIWRRDVKVGFIANIRLNHSGMLPTVTSAYCCENYKHNPKYTDACKILGIRKFESRKRANRTALMVKNKTQLKKMKSLVSEYFHEQCQSVGANNILTLHPIIDWTDKEVWEYIHKHKLPINPEYKENKRIGCLVCPKANFTSNYKALLKYPKLIDCFIKARDHITQDWVITGDNQDYSDDKVYYICRWLNHSFMPFTKKQEEYYKQVKQRYYENKTNSTNNNRTNVADSSNERNTQHNRWV